MHISICSGLRVFERGSGREKEREENKEGQVVGEG